MADRSSMSVTWVLEAEVFLGSHKEMATAVEGEGGKVVLWRDDWLKEGGWPALEGRAVVFHGSLGNADAIASQFPWKPGAFCDEGEFRCSAWYPRARPWLLHERWAIVPLIELVGDPDRVMAEVGATGAVFVRPDSPLKPFSGRVVTREAISLRAFDHGFYFEDEALPVVVAPVRAVDREWRFVVVEGEVVAGSGYEAERRSAVPGRPGEEPWRFASRIANEFEAPQAVSVLDICEADGGLHLLEANPFSGADLYACDRGAVVRAVSKVAAAMVG